MKSIHEKDKTIISFGRLSDPGVVSRSPLANPYKLRKDAFSSENFQYIADHILEMYGYSHGTVRALVEPNDWVPEVVTWKDNNKTRKEIRMQFTMNARIYPLLRTSEYGQNFLFQHAMHYGFPIVFGIIAHEMGHLMVSHSLHAYQIQQKDRVAWLVQTQGTEDYWNELCADFLAGITLARAKPALDPTGLISFIARTEPDESHPHGFHRARAIQLGYKWGQTTHNTTSLLDEYMYYRSSESHAKLFEAFFDLYNAQYYSKLSKTDIMKYGALPPAMRIHTSRKIMPM
ncbi:hypothetical protein LJC74_06545 [Eubacteriales bacterium OttesenSCG-928-A19]|nr:hypothetical protein [Eubacteriales bacterium OttesenSCG-928-A19]